MDDRYGPHDRNLRCADSDREAVADILREQHVAGRLDSDELQERIDRCYSAKTYAELDAVVADLPREQPQPNRGRGGWMWPRFALVPLLLIALVALSHGHLFWLAVPLVFFLFVRPMLWRSGRHMCGRRYPATGSRSPSTIV
ncbi:MAG TPA: DUF1707 domain-containing protein [Solirubrobacteraceae bacterium]|nr:DUF1707 domain-containing protein [Solirubrobacteraceae bacterium]